jgi:hypothetical protein
MLESGFSKLNIRHTAVSHIIEAKAIQQQIIHTYFIFISVFNEG